MAGAVPRRGLDTVDIIEVEPGTRIKDPVIGWVSMSDELAVFIDRCCYVTPTTFKRIKAELDSLRGGGVMQ